jgi:hypothetical protein
MWYYIKDNKPVGPVDGKTLKELFVVGTITLNTRIWKKGMPDWVKLSEFSTPAQPSQPGASDQPHPEKKPQQPQPLQQQPQDPPHPVESLQQPQALQPLQQDRQSQPTQPAAQQQAYQPLQQPNTLPTRQAVGYQSFQPTNQFARNIYRSPVRLASLKSLYFTWLVFIILNTFVTLGLSLSASNFAGVTNAAIGLTCAQAILGLVESILMFILVYHFWKTIQDGYARTSPGKAVGFLFIPVFFYYWIFVAFFGLSQDLNAFIKRHFPEPADEDIRRSSPILLFIFSFMVLANLMVTIITISTTVTNMMAVYTGAATIDNSLFVTLFALVYNVITIIAFTDLYETESSILIGLTETRRAG